MWKKVKGFIRFLFVKEVNLLPHEIYPRIVDWKQGDTLRCYLFNLSFLSGRGGICGFTIKPKESQRVLTVG
jgi:hypothetical protein